MSTSVQRNIGTLALDVFLSLMLFIVACAFAGAIQQFVIPHVRWLYSVWFAIGMLPFCFYARYRGVFAFDRWDILAYSPFPIAIGLTQHWLNHPMALFVMAVVMITAGSYVRALLPAGDARRPKNGTIADQS